ncbi:acyl-CoA/acyl-ACP dehydrogenase [Oxyplasma meridianum]|uniref:Acyl-CoA/acyl-ACP dehydrogenase n=1 Tax=Oxyplasma meridianum TaxID=3073602 RepID=A0AAX4NHD5_9ARCH
MENEEYDILRSSIREFIGKEIEGKALDIEKRGITDEITKSMAAQGFLGSRFPENLGGSNLDRGAYSIILQETARVSPSLAVKILLINSVAGELLKDSEAKNIIPSLLSGEEEIGIAFSEVLNGLHGEKLPVIKDGKIQGFRETVMNSGGKYLLTAAEGEKSPLVLVKSGLNATEVRHQLGFRGLKISQVNIDSGEYTELCPEGSKKFTEVIDGLGIEVSAIALGICYGAVTKAVDYAKVRTTFQKPLKDYGPVASSLSDIISELEILQIYLDKSTELDAKHVMMIKNRSLDLMKRATKLSLQVHGGYGYIQDFGVEKFYRDSMALSNLLVNGRRDSLKLAGFVFESPSGTI